MPKMRRVVLTLEVETDVPLRLLRKASNLTVILTTDANRAQDIGPVEQAQANVIDAD